SGARGSTRCCVSAGRATIRQSRRRFRLAANRVVTIVVVVTPTSPAPRQAIRFTLQPMQPTLSIAGPKAVERCAYGKPASKTNAALLIQPAQPCVSGGRGSKSAAPSVPLLRPQRHSAAAVLPLAQRRRRLHKPR